MPLLRHPVRNESIKRIPVEKQPYVHKDYSDALSTIFIISVIVISFWIVITVIAWMIDRDVDHDTRTLFQYIGSQWDWIKDTAKHIF